MTSTRRWTSRRSRKWRIVRLLDWQSLSLISQSRWLFSTASNNLWRRCSDSSAKTKQTKSVNTNTNLKMKMKMGNQLRSKVCITVYKCNLMTVFKRLWEEPSSNTRWANSSRVWEWGAKHTKHSVSISSFTPIVLSFRWKCPGKVKRTQWKNWRRISHSCTLCT